MIITIIKNKYKRCNIICTCYGSRRISEDRKRQLKHLRFAWARMWKTFPPDEDIITIINFPLLANKLPLRCVGVELLAILLPGDGRLGRASWRAALQHHRLALRDSAVLRLQSKLIA